MMAGKLEALRRLPGQRLLVLVGVLLLGTSAGAVPSPAAACTGCPMPLSEAVKDAAYGALVTVEAAAPDGAYALRVDRVLRGATTLSAFIRFFAPPSTATSLPGDSRGSAPFVGALGALLGFGLWLARPRRGGRSTPSGA